MQTRIITRFTTFIVFVFTCCLTMTVVANERGLAPLLSPDAWKLLSDAEAIAQGFTPTITRTLELEPRQKIEKKELIKRPNSRIKVKFADDLKIRLDVHNKPYSRTMQPQSVSTVCDSLGITLVPTISRSQDDVDALIYKAESISRKQMPDIGGIYWITGDETAADVAAELFWTMEEVEWVIYKPVYSKMPRGERRLDFSIPQAKPQSSKATNVRTAKAPIDTTFGACLFDKNECLEDLGQRACHNQGGTFLGPNSICFYEEDENRSAILPGPAECCILSGCVKTVTQAACSLLGGVVISVIVPPAVPCLTNTVCPPGVGPTLAAIGACGAIGTPITVMSGDCYIDQTFIYQTNRVAPAPLPASPTDGVTLPTTNVGPNGRAFGFPGGCFDTNGLDPSTGGFGGPGIPAAGPPLGPFDFTAASGIIIGSPINWTPTTCCVNITTDVPFCAVSGPNTVPYQAWNAVCASYANHYAGNFGPAGCTPRGSVLNPTIRTTICKGPLGPNIPPIFTQSQLNLALISSADTAILLTNVAPVPGPNAAFQIVETPITPLPNGCGDGDCVLNIYTITVPPAAPLVAIPIVGANITTFAATINAAVGAAGFVASIEGPGTMPVGGATIPVPETLLNPTSLVFVNNGTSFPQSMAALPLFNPVTGLFGCTGPSGSPTFNRSLTLGLTPDYAAMGLLTWMSPQFTPWPGDALNVGGQTFALPNSGTPLTADQMFHINQLLPWPMGGALIQNTPLQPTATLTTPVTGLIPKLGGTLAAPILTTGSPAGWWGGDGGVDLFPDFPNPGGFGGAEVYKGAYGYGQMLADEGEGTAGPNGALMSGAFGNGVKVAVLDWSAYLDNSQFVPACTTCVPPTPRINLGGFHEEFLVNGVAGTSRVAVEGVATGHTPLTLHFDENAPFGYSADHGTGVLGIIGANWSTASPLPGAPTYPPSIAQRLGGVGLATPNIGVLGMAPDAQLFFFPLTTLAIPDREEQAWFNAIETLDAGDVICAAYLPVSTNGLEPNLNYWADVASYLQIANGLGICTVIRAGDIGVDLSAIELPNGDQNVFVATAVTPGSSVNNVVFQGAPIGVPGPPTNPLTTTTAKRYCDGTRGSNFSIGTQTDGNAIYRDVTSSGWGMGVITCGKGMLRDNYLGYNTISYTGTALVPCPACVPPVAQPTSAQDPWIVNSQSYTNLFGNTGSAAAQVAGAVAIVQGVTKQVFGIPMGNQICRQLIAGGTYAGRNRDGTPILRVAPRITTEVAVDSICETAPNTLDWDWCPAPGAGNLVGNLNDPRQAMFNAIHNPIFDTPNIDTTLLIRGSLLFGNRFSLAAIDGNLLGALPVRTKAHQPYAVPAGVPGGPVRYLGNGLVTDLFLAGELSTLPMNNTFTVNVTFYPTQQSTLIVRLEMLDARTGRWRQAAATTALPLNSTAAFFQVERASAFINASDGYFMRLITLDINSPHDEGPTAVYPVFYDQIRITSGIIQN